MASTRKGHGSPAWLHASHPCRLPPRRAHRRPRRPSVPLGHRRFSSSPPTFRPAGRHRHAQRSTRGWAVSGPLPGSGVGGGGAWAGLIPSGQGDPPWQEGAGHGAERFQTPGQAVGETGPLWVEPVTGRPGVSGPGSLQGTNVLPVLQVIRGWWVGHPLTAQELAGVPVSGVWALKGLPELQRAKAPTTASASSPASSPRFPANAAPGRQLHRG